MYNTLKTIHSYWAYAALILLLIALITSLIGWLTKKEFSSANYKWGLYGFIASHIQLLLGLILLFLSPYWEALMSDTGGVMKDSSIRLLAVEHPVMNILALILITIGWTKHKKKESSESKFRTIAIFYGVGIVLLLSRIPWSQWHGAQ